MKDKRVDWGVITPEEVSEYISFKKIDGSGDDGKGPASNSMYNIQAEGTARLWNLLDTKHLALLADDVGMGKTIQALAVCALLWRIDPHARILVIAPNHSVAQNWVNEYTTFINSHIRKSDNLVRTEIGSQPVYKPFLCGNLTELEEIASSGWCHFIIAKTTSLSTSSSTPNDDISTIIKTAYCDGAKRNQHIITEFGGKIDLLIIDEAQYYRKFDGDSLRVNTARGLFGAPPPDAASKEKRTEALARRTLLVTATPNHTSDKDVQNLVRYFNQDIANSNSPDILKKIGVRRLRRLHDRIKYQYRNEEDLECPFEKNILGELFFALYQRKLAAIARDKNERRSFTYGYLEGFESIPIPEPEQKVKQEESSDETEGGNDTDYRHSKVDGKLLQDLAQDYRRLLDDFPVHPKYTTITDKISTFTDDFWTSDRDNTNDKNLIFVRRIPSVHELAARINGNYDKLFMKKIYSSWGDENKNRIPTRAEYNAYVASKIGKSTIVDDPDPQADDGEGAEIESEKVELNSQVLDLFREKRTDTQKDAQPEDRYTHASNFRRRFSNDTDPFSLFFLPSADYKEAPYTVIFQEEKEGRNIYESSAHFQRLGKRGGSDQITIFQHIGKPIPEGRNETDGHNLPTLWEIYYPLLDEKYKKIIGDMSLFEKEGLAKYLQKGILFASASLIELYGWFIEAQVRTPAQEGIYTTFIQVVKDNLKDSLLFTTIRLAIEQFSVYTEKICGFYDKVKLIDESWNIFNRQNPAYPCTGDTKNRQRLINTFNSPFFPNVLVSTSVLQEGVNLQYNCRNVYHYGIAWTTGDNEQRVGRIDRLFSLVERDIERDIKHNQNNACLNIFYPYLADSFDRDQVAEFVKKKYKNELTLDQCGNQDSRNVISESSSYIPHWENFLRRPDPKAKVADPFPATFPAENALEHTSQYKDHVKEYPSIKIVEENLLNKITQFVYSSYTKGAKVLKTSELQTQMALIEIILENGRHQPVVAELNYSSELSGLVEGTVYYLTFRSPLTSDASNLESFQDCFKKYFKQYPLVQLCHDKSVESQFTVYMRTDIPLFINRKLKKSNISNLEISSMFSQLVEFSDLVERTVFGEGQDITLQDVKKEEQHETEELYKKRGRKLSFDYSKPAKPFCKAMLTNAGNRNPEYKNLSPMQLTHEFQFVSFREGSKYLILELYYPEGDIDEKEAEILKKWFSFVKGRVESAPRQEIFPENRQTCR